MAGEALGPAAPIWRSIRTRVVVGSIVLLLLALGASVLVVREMLRARLDADVERELAQEVEELRALSDGNDPVTGEPFADDVEAIFRTFMERNVAAPDEAFYAFVDGRASLYSFEAPTAVLDDEGLVERWTAATEPTRTDIETPDGPTRTLAVPAVGSDGEVLGTFVVAVFLEDRLAEVDGVAQTVALVAGLALLVSSVGAWLVAGRVLRPVRDLTVAAREIDAGDLTRRIEVKGHDELAELGATFNGMLDRLDAAFRTQREFLDDVAHELRTPITIARGHLELVGDDADQRAETVAIVTDELDRMSRYVDDLLVVAKAARPDFLRLGLVDVTDLLDDVLARAAPLADRSWVRGDAPQPGEVLLLGDEGRLTQALLALVTNAVQHTEDGGRVEVGAEVTGETVRLVVADDGPGLDDVDRDRLFARFSRGAASASRRPGGTGLGLAIVSAIAQAHGGRAGVESSPGRGARFHLDLPLRRPDEEAR